MAALIWILSVVGWLALSVLTARLAYVIALKFDEGEAKDAAVWCGLVWPIAWVVGIIWGFCRFTSRFVFAPTKQQKIDRKRAEDTTAYFEAIRQLPKADAISLYGEEKYDHAVKWGDERARWKRDPEWTPNPSRKAVWQERAGVIAAGKS